ncbi:hypothetical protein EDC96DRAFT_501704 [Choanephora cucurbitarum]|nr:hypothetical protein EDC96DRAFT_501704 [Choanephora cucurbitarum]
MPISLGRSGTIKEEKPKLKRSSTLSRVKSFGSKLIRSNSQYRLSHQPTKTPPPPLPSSSVSLKSDDSEEDQVVTPTTGSFSLHDDDKQSMVTPDPYVNQSTPVLPELHLSKTNNTIFLAEEETPLTTVSLVRYHIADAFREVDQEIEQEFDLSHQDMLNSIYASPRYTL